MVFKCNTLHTGKRPTKYWLQCVATISASLGALTFGIHDAWSSPSIPKLSSNETEIQLTETELSWIAVMPVYSALFGVFLGIYIPPLVGHKIFLLASSLVYCVAWILIGIANNFLYLLFARVIAGIGNGFSAVALIIYVCEIADSKIRGTLATCILIAQMFGRVLINAVAPYLSISTTAYICIIFPAIQFLVFIFMPESPYFLIMKHKYDHAKISLKRLRRTDQIDDEFEDIKSAVQRQLEDAGKCTDMIFNAVNRKAILTMICLVIFQQFSGAHTFILYAQTVFEEFGSNLSSAISAIIFAVVQLMVTFLTTLVIDKIGRRIIILVSSFGTGILLLLIGLLYYLRETNRLIYNPIILVVLMFIYILIYGIGLGIIPFIQGGELFPAKLKTIAVCILNITSILSSASITLLYQAITPAFGLHTSFFIFGCFTLLGTIFIYVFVIETKGKTLEEIQLQLKQINSDM